MSQGPLNKLKWPLVTLGLASSLYWYDQHVVQKPSTSFSNSPASNDLDVEPQRSDKAAKLMAMALEARIDQGCRVLREHLQSLIDPAQAPLKLEGPDVVALAALCSSYRQYSSSDGPWMRRPLRALESVQVGAPVSREGGPKSKALIPPLLTLPDEASWLHHGPQLRPILNNLDLPPHLVSIWSMMNALQRKDRTVLPKLLQELRALALEQSLEGDWKRDNARSIELTAWNVNTFNLARILLGQ